MSFYGDFLVTRIPAICAALIFAWPAAGASDPLASGTLAVRQTMQCCYFEGSVSYVFVRQVGSDLDTVRATRLQAPLEPTLIAATQLTPGRYVVSSFQRPCDISCAFLDPPVDECSSDTVELRPGRVVSLLASVIPFGGCTITIDTGSI